jgi:tetratricopeptide (TPR) repeat protein
VLWHLSTAESLAESLGDNRRRGQVSYALSNYFWQMGEPDRAFECGRRALVLAADLGDVDLQLLANEQLGATHHVQGDYRRAIAALSKIVVALEGAPLRQRIVRPQLAATRSCANLVMCLAELGVFAEGNARGADAVRLAEATDSPYGRCLAYLGVGYLHLRQGDLHRAIPVLERGLELCETVGIPLAFPWLAPPLGAVHALAGRAAEALPLLEQATEQATGMRLRVWQSVRIAWQSEASLLAGLVEDAGDLACRALEHSREHQERGSEAWTLRLLGEIAARREPPENDQTEAYYRQALALAEELGMRPLQAHCHRGLGTLSVKLGRWEDARTELATAIKLYRAMDMTFWLPQAEAAQAEVKGR